MPKLSKRILAETFKTDCERFFRFELANKSEKKTLGIDGNKFTLGNRPGVQLMQEAGNKWEIDKYEDLILGYGEDRIKFLRRTEVNPRLGVKEFKEISNLVEVLNQPVVPIAIIEGGFAIPRSVSSELEDVCKMFDIEPSRAIPDIIWFRPYSSGAPLIQHDEEPPPEYELHIIDVKMAAQASLKHFTEVTFYALALDAFIRENGLEKRFRVSAKGLIWPGSHDVNNFRNLLQKYRAQGNQDPTLESLNSTLISVPYEVYEVHVRRFFKERMIPILSTPPLEVPWHVSSKCQLCQYLKYCQKMANDLDHLSKISWMSKTQVQLFSQYKITETKELFHHISNNTEVWNHIKTINHQLRADELGIKARLESLQDNDIKIISERNTQLMPNWVDMSVYLTFHFDPGSGISFALGAKRVYFKKPRSKGDPPIKDEQVFIIERVEELNPDTERNRLIEFIDLVSSWYMEVDSDNERIRDQRKASGERDSPFGKMSAHAFFWSQLEATQFMRMIERHMEHPSVIEKIELLLRLFPPESVLPTDPHSYKSQPGTIVKKVVRQLVGIPLPHDYTLIESANKFYPNIKEDGSPYQYFQSFGFTTLLNDQIPFERAYELWKDDIFLKHSKAKGGRKYNRGEIYDGITRSISVYLNALQHMVMKLREHCGDQLILKKPPFSAARLTRLRLPERSIKLNIFNKLNAITREIENMHNTSLPVDEKEAKFISLRGIIDKTTKYNHEIEDLKKSNEELLNSRIIVLEFSENSRDCKIKEGNFLCCITNEDLEVGLSSYWYTALGLDFYAALELLNNRGIQNPDRRIKMKLSQMFQVSILRLNSTAKVPYVMIEVPGFNAEMFEFGIEKGLLDLDSPMVIDPIYKDFESEDILKVLRLIGN